MTERAFRSGEAIQRGWEITKAHFLSLLLPLSALLLILGGAEGTAQRNGQGLLHLVMQVLSMLVTMGVWRVVLRLDAGEPASLSALKEVDVVGFVRYLLAIVFFWVVVGIGLVLLVLPGLYLATRLFLAPILVIDRGLDPVAALKRSWELTDDVLVDVIVFFLFLFGINLLGAIPAGLGLLVTTPISFLATVHVYRRLSARRPETSTGTPLGPVVPT